MHQSTLWSALAGAFTGWYNGRPHHPAPQVQDVRTAVIIGNGSVELCLARFLGKVPSEFAGSDFSPLPTQSEAKF